MKKFKFILLLFAVFSLVFITGCDNNNDVPNTDDSTTNDDNSSDITDNTQEDNIIKCTVTLMDSNGNTLKTLTVAMDTAISETDIPTKEGYDFEGLYTNKALTKKHELTTKIGGDKTLYVKYVLTQYTIKFDSEGGTEFEDVKYNYFEKVSLPIPSKDGYIFDYWTDENGTQYKHIPSGSKTNYNLKAVYRTPSDLDMAFINKADEANIGVLNNTPSGIYTITATVRSRIATWTNPADSNDSITFSQSYKFDSSTSNIMFTASGNGKLSFYVQNGSTTATTQNVKVQCGSSTQTFEFSGTTAVAPYPAGNPIVKITLDVEASKTYKILRDSGTIDIFAVKLECGVRETSISGVQLQSVGNVDYIEGQEFMTTNFSLAAIHGDNSYFSEINNENISFDTSEIDMTKAGTYNVIAKYGQYTATYKINVYSVETLELGFNSTYESRNSYNGIYVNGKVKTIYSIGEEFDDSYLTAIVNGLNNTKTKSFIIDDGFTYTGFDSTTAGVKTITATYCINNKTFNTTYNVFIVNTAPYVDSNNNYVVTVDKSYTGVIGEQNGINGNMFTTISQALEYLSSSRISTSASKILNISAGLYTEKIEINVPNLTIIGAGCTKATYNKDSKYSATSYNSATIIEWDSLYGIPDKSGYSQVTDSTATVAVREAAVNCTIKNVTLSNYWNCEDRFMDNIKYLTEQGIAVSNVVNDHRALALIVQADKFTMNNCSLLGYQDTVEFMTGRQFVYKTYISGNTDFIFGTNATTYFYDCEIFVNYKSGGAGYVTAYKGCNKGGTDYVEYGFIFDNCQFTSDSKVGNGTFALGRPWGPYSAVMIMNSQIGTHISKSSGRYVSMSGTNPSDETVRYTEYNNTGNAIEASTSSVDLVDSTTASNYNNISLIYGTTNGLVTYAEAWVPTLYTEITQ